MSKRYFFKELLHQFTFKQCIYHDQQPYYYGPGVADKLLLIEPFEEIMNLVDDDDKFMLGGSTYLNKVGVDVLICHFLAKYYDIEEVIVEVKVTASDSLTYHLWASDTYIDAYTTDYD